MNNQNYNSSNYRGNNNNYYESNNNMYHNAVPKQKNNMTLMIVTIVLAFVAITASAVAITLNFTKSSGTKSSAENNLSKDTSIEAENVEPDSEPQQAVVDEPEDVITKTMYVDCNTTLILRKGPGKGYDEILQIPTGDAVVYVKDAGNNFARVIYNGTPGYVSLDYLSGTKPYVWQYNESEVKDFTEKVLYAFVTSVNNDDVSYLTQYLSGQAVADAHTSHNQIKKVTSSEEVLSVNCHSVKRVSKTRVSVVRESVIRVYRHNGDIDDVSEKYLTTIENTADGMRVIKFEKIK